MFGSTSSSAPCVSNRVRAPSRDTSARRSRRRAKSSSVGITLPCDSLAVNDGCRTYVRPSTSKRIASSPRCSVVHLSTLRKRRARSPSSPSRRTPTTASSSPRSIHARFDDESSASNPVAPERVGNLEQHDVVDRVIVGHPAQHRCERGPRRLTRLGQKLYGFGNASAWISVTGVPTRNGRPGASRSLWSSPSGPSGREASSRHSPALSSRPVLLRPEGLRR